MMKPITLHNSQVLINKKEINIKLQNMFQVREKCGHKTFRK